MALLEAEVRGVRARGVGVQVVVRSGDPAATLLEVADDVDADLVVVGTRCHPRPDELLLGSVARTVADRARRPTLVVPATAGPVHLRRRRDDHPERASSSRGHEPPARRGGAARRCAPPHPRRRTTSSCRSPTASPSRCSTPSRPSASTACTCARCTRCTTGLHPRQAPRPPAARVVLPVPDHPAGVPPARLRAGAQQLQRSPTPAAADNQVLAGAGGGAPMDRHGYFSLGTNCDYVALFIGTVPFFLEVNGRMPRTSRRARSSPRSP